jgi:hypothetical protein
VRHAAETSAQHTNALRWRGLELKTSKIRGGVLRITAAGCSYGKGGEACGLKLVAGMYKAVGIIGTSDETGRSSRLCERSHRLA